MFEKLDEKLKSRVGIRYSELIISEEDDDQEDYVIKTVIYREKARGSLFIYRSCYWKETHEEEVHEMYLSSEIAEKLCGS